MLIKNYWGWVARSVEQLQDAARSHQCALADAVDAVAGKAGTNLRAFVAKIDVMREQTQGKTLREIIELVLEQSSLLTHYETEREGEDRLENLGELVNAAESFVTQEGFDKEAVAMPLDEVAGTVEPLSAEAATQLGLQPDTGEVLSPLAEIFSR